MYRHHHDTTSSVRTTPRILVRLALCAAVAFALVAASVSAAPSSAKTSANAPQASTAAKKKCVAYIMRKGKLRPFYQKYWKYKYKKLKGSKRYQRKVVHARRKMKVACARQCVKTRVRHKKRVPVYKIKRRKVKVKKGNRIVKRKRKVRVYVFQKCKTKPGSSVTGTPVTVTLLPDSYANLDFGAFQRKAGITGQLKGFIPGGYHLNQDAQINLSKGDMQLTPTDIFIDDECNGQVSAAIRTGTPTLVYLNPTKQSISNLSAAGGVTATAYVRIRLPLDLRNGDDGCNKPYIPTGYTEFEQTFFLKGKLGNGQTLGKLTLTSPPDPLDVQACLAQGLPTSPCNNDAFVIPLPIIVSTHLVVSIQLK